MNNRLGFLSGTGIIAAIVVLGGVVAWTLIAGPTLFSPGPLSAATKGRTLGGVTSHASLGANCAACHTAPWSSSTMADRCIACHSEVSTQIQNRSGLHGRLLGALTTPTCRGCHTDHRGVSASLTVVDPETFPHELTRYSLRGHERTAKGTRFVCADCHPRDLAHFDQATCAECHTSIDTGFMTKHEAAFGMECLLCHTGNRDGADFDHNKLPFKLVGKHAKVKCEQCHFNRGSAQSPQATPQDCFSCHAKDDKHKGAYGQKCEQCHSANGWPDATFDHKVFPLNHGSERQKSTCQTCHPTNVNTYTCYGCHEHTPARVRSDHEGQSLAKLANCIRCHAGGRKGGD